MSLMSEFESLPLVYQIIAFDFVFVPIGAALGWFAAPDLGVEPLVGLAAGGVVGTLPTALLIVKHGLEEG